MRATMHGTRWAMCGTRVKIGYTLPPLLSVKEQGGEGPVRACMPPLGLRMRAVKTTYCLSLLFQPAVPACCLNLFKQPVVQTRYSTYRRQSFNLLFQPGVSSSSSFDLLFQAVF